MELGWEDRARRGEEINPPTHGRLAAIDGEREVSIAG